jgi:hypothetical protein
LEEVGALCGESFGFTDRNALLALIDAARFQTGIAGDLQKFAAPAADVENSA